MTEEKKIPQIITDKCLENGFEVELRERGGKHYYLIASPEVPFDVSLCKEIAVEDYKNVKQFADAVEELWGGYSVEEEVEIILDQTDSDLRYESVYAECETFDNNLYSLFNDFDESDFYEWFEFEATFTFKGTVKVKARDVEHAYIRLQENFGGVGIDIGQGTLGDDEIDWDIDTHSEDTFDYND